MAKVYSVQPRFKPPGDVVGSWAWIDYLVRWGVEDPMPPYPSPARDAFLAETWKFEPVLAGAVSTATDKMSNTNWFVKGGRVNANRYARLFHTAEGGAGWARLMGTSYQDYVATNRGALIELGRAGRNKRTGQVLGMQHLDATRVMYTGNVGKPWRYLPEAADSVDLWAENVLQVVAVPSGRDRFQGSGECAVERLRNAIGLMVGWLTHDRQMVGNLPPEAIAIFNGLTQEKVQQSYENYKKHREQLMNAQGEGNPVYSGFWMMGSDDAATPLDVKFVPMRTTGTYDRNTFYEWWIKLIALNLGASVGQFWLIQHPGATKAVEGIQFEMERGKGVGRFAQELEWLINWKILPDGVRFEFDAQDDEQDQVHAEILGKNITNLLQLSSITDDLGDPLQTLDELKEIAVEWGILPPDAGKEQAPVVLGARLKEFSEETWIVRNDLTERQLRPPLVKNALASKFKEVAGALEVAYSPFALSRRKHLPGRHDQKRHGIWATGGGETITTAAGLTALLREKNLVRPRSEGFGGFIVNPTSIDDVEEHMLPSAAQSKYFSLSGVYDPKTGGIAFPLDTSHIHRDLATEMVGLPHKTIMTLKQPETPIRDRLLDRGVHFRLGRNPEGYSAEFDTNYAGVSRQVALNDAIENIYKAMDRLERIDGLDRDTPATVKGLETGLMETTLKHLPGRHDQKRHGIWAAGTDLSAKVEVGQVVVGGTTYNTTHSYGVKRSAENKAIALGSNFAVRRAEGKYFVVDLTTATAAGAKPPKPPKPPVAAGDASLHESAQINPGRAIHAEPGPRVGFGEVDDPSKTAVAKVESALGKLPVEHQELADRIVLSGQHDLLDSPTFIRSYPHYASEDSRVMDYSGLADYQTETLWLAAGRRSKQHLDLTTSHEVGHFVLGGRRGAGGWSFSGSPGFLDRRKATRKVLVGTYNERMAAQRRGHRPKAVSSYALTNRFEYMAESYAHYVSNPKLLQQKDPQAYAILRDELFQGQEYGGMQTTEKHLPGRHDQKLHGSWAAGGSANLQVALTGAEDRIRNISDHEEAYAFDAQGNQLWHAVGDAETFGPPAGQWQGAVVTHNHPTGHPDAELRSLSVSDVQVAMDDGVSEIRAVGPDWTSSMQIPPQPDTKAARKVLDQVLMDTREPYFDKVSSGEMTKLDAKKEIWQEVWPRFAAEPSMADAGFSYTFAEGLSTQEKHLPGRHDQKLHGSWAAGRVISAKAETRTVVVDGVAYDAEYNYGVKRSAQNKARKLGEGYEVVRHKGKYYVARPSARAPEFPPRRPVDAPVTIPARADLPGGQLIRPGSVVPDLEPQGSGNPDQKDVVSLAVSQLPLDHQRSVESVRVTDTLYLADDPEFYGIAPAHGKSWVGLCDASNNVWVAGSSASAFRTDATVGKTAVHEVGHAVFSERELKRKQVSPAFDARRRETNLHLEDLYNTRLDDAIAVGASSGQAPSRIKAVTFYARTNNVEFAAETYAYYVTDPVVLKVADPEAYSIMQDFFEGQEY